METLFRWTARALASSDVLFSLIRRWAFRHPYSDIIVDGQYYMGRWWVLREHPWLPFAIRLHQIAMPDQDRHLHDHRSWYRTFILRGWYVEQSASKLNLELRSAGDTVSQPASHFHRITGVSNRTCWTLFVYGRHQQDWGFLKDGKKIHWATYLGLRPAMQKQEEEK